MTDELIYDKMLTAKVGLLIRAPFFGHLVSRLKLIENNAWCKSAATDGRNIYYNSEFVSKLTPSNIEFLFAHEVGHCILEHIGRTGSRDKTIANLAKDFAINQILKDENIGTQMEGVLQADEFRGLCWEEIYDILIEYSENDLNKMFCIDIHLNLSDEFGDNGDTPSISPEDLNKIQNDFKAMVIEASNSAGLIPSSFKRLISDLTSPSISWKDVLRMNIKSLFRDRRSYLRPNKKSLSTGVILQGKMHSEAVDIAVALDMSGSISDKEAAIFLSECVGIVRQFKDFGMDVFCFDTDVHNHKRITHRNRNDLLNYQVKGGGGTEFSCIFDFLKKQSIKPKKLVVFSDCYTYDWGDPKYADTLFVIKGNDNCIPPYGKFIHFKG